MRREESMPTARPIEPITLSGMDSDRLAAGKLLREKVPLASHEGRKASPRREDPVALLQAEDVDRVQNLLPMKYGRMSASPFAFLRGSAAVMAADLARTPVTRLYTQLCGDAHGRAPSCARIEAMPRRTNATPIKLS
jgi:hypothetical protein